MKKPLCSLMILAFLFSLALPLYGGEEYDAFHVDEEHALEYKFKPDDSAVMIYSGMYFAAAAVTLIAFPLYYLARKKSI